MWHPLVRCRAAEHVYTPGKPCCACADSMHCCSCRVPAAGVPALLQLPCAHSRCPSGADGGSESLMLWGQPRRGAVWWDEGQGEEDGSRARRVRGGAEKLNSLPLVTAVIWSREP